MSEEKEHPELSIELGSSVSIERGDEPICHKCLELIGPKEDIHYIVFGLIKLRAKDGRLSKNLTYMYPRTSGYKRYDYVGFCSKCMEEIDGDQHFKASMETIVRALSELLIVKRDRVASSRDFP